MKSRDPFVEAMREKLRERPIVPTICPMELRTWWVGAALPTLKDQALSELRRRDQVDPRLVGFRDNGELFTFDLLSAAHGTFGDDWSKRAAWNAHAILARVPGIKASVLCTETWMLDMEVKPGTDMAAAEKIAKGMGRISDHPDRQDAMQFNMLSYRESDGAMFQMMTMIVVNKLFAKRRTFEHWASTTFGVEKTVDPQAMRGPDGKQLFTGGMVL